jgi:hypothetical protein
MPWRGRTSRVVKNPGATDNRGRGYVETGNRGYISIVERPFEGAAFVSELGLRLLDADRGHWALGGTGRVDADLLAATAFLAGHALLGLLAYYHLTRRTERWR